MRAHLIVVVALWSGLASIAHADVKEASPDHLLLQNSRTVSARVAWTSSHQVSMTC